MSVVLPKGAYLSDEENLTGIGFATTSTMINTMLAFEKNLFAMRLAMSVEIYDVLPTRGRTL